MSTTWQQRQVADFCEVIAGQSPEGRFYNTEGKGLPFYQGKKDFGERFISAPTTWTMQATKIAKPGDILMSVRAPVGPVNFAAESICIGRGLAAIRTGSELDRDFLFYQLLHLQPRIAGRDGAVFASISKAEIEALPLAFAPLPEQRRLVGVLNNAFEAIATANADVGKNLQNARALFESHLQAEFGVTTVRRVQKRLGDVCSFVGGSQPPKSVFSKTKRTDYVRLIQIRDYKSDKYAVYIPRSQAKRFCDAHDVMIGRYGPPLFQILRGLEGAYNVALMKAVPRDSVVSHDYLFYFLKHSAIRDYVIYHSERAAGQIGLNKETLEPYPIWLPSPQEQQKVVQRTVEFEVGTRRLESIYQRKIATLHALRRSLLDRAFSGKL